MTDTLTPTRTCRKCGQTKPLSEFARNSQCRQGRSYTCKTCAYQNIKANKEDRRRRLRNCVSCGQEFSGINLQCPACCGTADKHFTARCVMCGAPFTAGGSWAKFCPDCVRVRHNEQAHRSAVLGPVCGAQRRIPAGFYALVHEPGRPERYTPPVYNAAELYALLGEGRLPIGALLEDEQGRIWIVAARPNGELVAVREDASEVGSYKVSYVKHEFAEVGG